MQIKSLKPLGPIFPYPGHYRSKINGVIVFALTQNVGVIVESDIVKSKVGTVAENFDFSRNEDWIREPRETTFKD